MRMNIAAPTSVIQIALNNIATALQA